MGLVVAYTRNGNPQQAAALCQSLYQSDTPQVKEWAARTLANLAKRYPQIPGLNLDTADVGIGESDRVAEPNYSVSSDSSNTQTDLTGFVPFDASSQPSQSTVNESIEADSTGFTPFSSAPVSREGFINDKEWHLDKKYGEDEEIEELKETPHSPTSNRQPKIHASKA